MNDAVDEPAFSWQRVAKVVGIGVAGFIVAAVGAILIYEVGKFLLECSPGQQDGQCGLGSFMALVLAGFCGIILWPVSTTLLYRKLMPAARARL